MHIFALAIMPWAYAELDISILSDKISFTIDCKLCDAGLIL